jgi:hypothetical protein
MSNQYYLATKGVQKSVEALISILKKVNQAENGKPVFDAKIAPDMFGFNKQVTVVSDNLKGMDLPRPKIQKWKTMKPT